MAIVKRSKNDVVDTDERSGARDFPGLTADLGDENQVKRRWAARDLAIYSQAAPVLIERLFLEQDSSVREAILISLTQIGDDTAVQGFIRCLRSEDARLRNEAIDAMKNLPDAVAPIMKNLLNDVDPDVRIFSVNVLESLRHPQVENWLIRVISHDENLNVCGTATDLLCEVGTLAAVLPLEALKQRFPDEPYIAFAADLALRRIREA